MTLLAALAVSLAESIPAEAAGTPANTDAIDLQALAWAELGNAHRVATDLPQAEAELSRALSHAQRERCAVEPRPARHLTKSARVFVLAGQGKWSTVRHQRVTLVCKDLGRQPRVDLPRRIDFARGA